jgi:hypothetical protein
MIELTENETPILPGQRIVDEECIAMGVVEQGVIVQYIERNKTLLISWDEIVRFGMGSFPPNKYATAAMPKEITKPGKSQITTVPKQVLSFNSKEQV